LQDDLCNLVVHHLTADRIKSITGNRFYKNSFTVCF
jgi:hypothetical protein